MARGKTIDRKFWLGIPGISLAMTSTSTALGAWFASDAPLTILRCRGELLVSMDGPALQDEVAITVGLGVISFDAFVAGAAAVPDPGEEPDFSWLYWKAMTFFAEATQVHDTTRSMRVEIDTKAMRKMKSRESLVWIAQYVDIVGTPPMQVSFVQTRVLVGI